MANFREVDRVSYPVIKFKPFFFWIICAGLLNVLNVQWKSLMLLSSGYYLKLQKLLGICKSIFFFFYIDAEIHTHKKNGKISIVSLWCAPGSYLEDIDLIFWFLKGNKLGHEHFTSLLKRQGQSDETTINQF